MNYIYSKEIDEKIINTRWNYFHYIKESLLLSNNHFSPISIMTSVISLAVLLLATYCYSVPIPPPIVGVSPDYVFTTGKTIVDHDNTFNMHYMGDDEVTTPIMKHLRTIEEPESVEDTTVDRVGHDDDLSHSSRSVGEGMWPLMETSTEFERRAIGSGIFPLGVELSTMSERSFVDNDSEMEMTTSRVVSSGLYKPQSSSSVDTFGKMTGLLPSGLPVEKPTRPEYERHDHSDETPKFEHHDHSDEEKPRLPMKPHEFTQTVSVIPGKTVETKVYDDVPSSVKSKRDGPW